MDSGGAVTEKTSNVVCFLIRAGISFPFSICAVGLPLAVAGAFKPFIVLPLVIIFTVLFATFARSLEFSLPGKKVLIAALILCVAISAFIGLWPSNHFVTNRDAGVYSITAHWMAKEGSLLVPSHEGAFNNEKLHSHGYAFYDTRSDHKLYPQFAHGAPAVFAVSEWIGGIRLHTRTNALIAGFALFSFFLFSRKFMRDILGLAATATLGLSLPFVWFARDTYSEPLTFLFAIFALLVLAETVERNRQSWVSWATAGALAGATLMVRVDGLVVVAAFVITMATLAIVTNIANRNLIIGSIASIGVGSIGWLDLSTRSSRYLTTEKSQVHSAFILIAFSILLLAVCLLARKYLKRFASITAFHGEVSAWIFTSFVAIAGVLAIVRPAFETDEGAYNDFVATLQRNQGLQVQAARKYAEYSVHWLTYYIGWATVLMAIIGVAILTYKWVRTFDHRFAILLVIAIPALLYFWRPGIAPDQIWATRRFIPYAMPATILMAFFLAEFVWLRWVGRIGTTIALLISAVMLGSSVYTTAQIPRARELRNTSANLDAVCKNLPSDTAALIIANGSIEHQLPQAIRIWCGIPTTVLPRRQGNEVIDEVNSEWSRKGRHMKLIVRSDTPPPPGWVVQSKVYTQVVELDPVLQKAPTKLNFQDLTLNILTPAAQ